MGDIKFTINPEQLLTMQGIKFHKKAMWINCKLCPFCDGGEHKQQYTFGVRADDYNYNCLRGSCGASGNFWMLLKHFGINPAEYVDKEASTYNKTGKKKHTKRYVYKRKDL